MADDIERLVLQMSADIRRLDKNTADGQRRFDRRLTEMEARARQADRNLSRIMDDAGRNMVGSLQRSLTAIAPTLAAAFSADQVIKYADSYTQLQNRLKAAGLEGEALKRVEDALYETANRNGLQVQATAELYQRASLSRQRLGASESELLALVSGTAAALKVQGTSAEAASGPLLQLGQVLGGAKVQAEEYNSLIDGLPVLLQAAAKGSARFGGDVAKLTTAVKAGEVTSQEFFQALLKGFPEIERQAAGAATTVGSALQTLDNELGRYIGQTDSSLSATQRLAEGIMVLSRNLDTVTTVVGLVATVVGGRFVVQMLLAAGATTAATVESVRYQAALLALEARQKGVSAATVLATAATRGFTAAIAANPIGAVLVAVTALAAGLFVLASRFNTTAVASRQLDQVVGAADETLERYRQAVEKAKNASDEERKGLDAKAAALRRVTLARINDAKVAAQQQIDEAVAARQRADEQIRRAGATRQAVGTNAGSNAGSALVGGARSSAQGAIALAVRARGEADTAIQAYERLKSVMEDIENPPAIGSPPAVAGEDGKNKKSSGPTPEELARQRELLALQGQIELLRAQGRSAEADAVQRRLDIANLEKQYADAGIENARAAAELQVNAVAQAEAAARGRATAQERANELLDMAVEAQRRQNDELLDQVSLEAELARLSGDPRRIELAERDLYITQRVNDLLRDRVGLITEADRKAAERQAGGEYDDLRTADLTGRVRDEIVDGLRDGLRSLAEGDVAGFFESVADRFTDRILDNLAEDLADLVMGAFKPGGGQAGGWLSSVFSMFGKRASGGPVMAGQSYIVGERRPEVFVPNVNGTVIPSVNAAMSRVQGGTRHTLNTTIKIDLTGANGDETIRRIAYDAAARGSAAAYAKAAQDIPRQSARRAGQQLGRR